MPRIAAIGEVMVELAPYRSAGEMDKRLKALSFAGDTFNTSVYMARLGTATDYVTILGDDPYSQQILDVMDEEGIGRQAIAQKAGSFPGLYMISNSADGEREFAYWRGEAPARQLFASDADAQALATALADCDTVYVTGITLAIISPEARQRLATFLGEFRKRGGTVAFDTNYRPRLWKSKDEAREAMLAIMAHTDMALLTLDDEQLLWQEGTVEACQSRYAHCALKELILKRGAQEVIVITPDAEEHVPVPRVENVLDTTGAGDTFNAGYLAARLRGLSPVEAAKEGIKCAGIVIRHPGGVIQRDVFESEYRA